MLGGSVKGGIWIWAQPRRHALVIRTRAGVLEHFWPGQEEL